MDKKYESILAERDIIGTQLVKKNDEIGLQDEKIKMLLVTLTTGEKQYAQRLDDIKLLRLEIRRLRREKNLLAKGIENMTDMRLEVFNLERDLNRERQKVRALEESLATPLNIHRWRKLQGTDPTSLELLDKVKIMQKKLLDKSQKVAEYEKLCKTLRDNMPKGPSPDLKAEIIRLKKVVFDQNEEMKGLVGELGMRETQLCEYKLDLQGAKAEIKELKEKIYALEKGKVDVATEISKLEMLPEPSSSERPPQRPVSKFFGGGFKVSPSPSKNP